MEAKIPVQKVRHVELIPDLDSVMAVPLLSKAPYVHFRWTISRVLAMAMSFFLGVFMTGTWWLKMALESENTVYEYLTNLVWIAIGLSYLVGFAGDVESLANVAAHYARKNYRQEHGYSFREDTIRPDYITYWNTLVITISVLAATFGVTFVVLAVIQDSPGLLFNYVDEYGEGTVVNFNFLFHVFTTLSVMVYVFLTQDHHRHVLFISLNGLLYLTVARTAIALLGLTTYLFGHNVSEVYNLTSALPTSVVIIMFFLIIITVVVVFDVVTSPWNALIMLPRGSTLQKHERDAKREDSANV